jgi:hypothetical protein
MRNCATAASRGHRATARAVVLAVCCLPMIDAISDAMIAPLIGSAIGPFIGAGEAHAESRRSWNHNTVGTSFPYHPGYFRFWLGERDIGQFDPNYPVPPSGYVVNPDPALRFPAERQFSRSRHMTGSDLMGVQGGSPNGFDVNAWYGWPEDAAVGAGETEPPYVQPPQSRSQSDK